MKKILIIAALALTGCNSLRRLTDGREVTTNVTTTTQQPAVVPVTVHPIVSPTPPPPPQQDTILLAGQSNMARIVWYALPEFKSKYEALHPHHTVQFVDCSVGGTDSSQWRSGGQLWGDCYDKARGYTITGIAFYQGESDAAIQETAWRANFLDAISGWRNAWHSASIPVVFAQIGICDPAFAAPADWDTVKQIQAGTVLENAKMIVTADVEVLVDTVHMDSASAQKIADRFAEAFANLK